MNMRVLSWLCCTGGGESHVVGDHHLWKRPFVTTCQPTPCHNDPSANNKGALGSHCALLKSELCDAHEVGLPAQYPGAGSVHHCTTTTPPHSQSPAVSSAANDPPADDAPRAGASWRLLQFSAARMESGCIANAPPACASEVACDRKAPTADSLQLVEPRGLGGPSLPLLPCNNNTASLDAGSNMLTSSSASCNNTRSLQMYDNKASLLQPQGSSAAQLGRRVLYTRSPLRNSSFGLTGQSNTAECDSKYSAVLDSSSSPHSSLRGPQQQARQAAHKGGLLLLPQLSFVQVKALAETDWRLVSVACAEARGEFHLL